VDFRFRWEEIKDGLLVSVEYNYGVVDMNMWEIRELKIKSKKENGSNGSK